MKILQSSFFRALTAIAVGILLIKYPDNTVNGIVIAIGVLFILSGLVSVLSYVNARRHASEYTIYDAQGRQIAGQQPFFPIVGVGSIILGAILALMPSTFISFMMYIIGAILIIGAIGQYFSIISARHFGSVSLFYWVCPTLILIAGVYMIVKPMGPLSTAMFILGWLTLFYGIVEAVNSMMFFAMKRRWEKEQQTILDQQQAQTAPQTAEEVGTEEATTRTSSTGTDKKVAEENTPTTTIKF